MQHKALSIRPFIGAKDFEVSRQFYKDLGFEETILGPSMSVFITQNLALYLQNAYVQDWIDNTMIFVEVEDANQYYNELSALNLTLKYENVKVVPTRYNDWGKEFFLHDPSGILWHFGTFF